jgi:hypothetical protein
MFNQQGQNWGIVTTNLSNVLKALRGALMDADSVCGWVIAQQAGDLVNIGATAPDAAQVQEVCQEIVSLVAMANGGAPPTATVNYVQNAIDLIGPYA